MKLTELARKKLGILGVMLLLVFCWVGSAAGQDTNNKNKDEWQFGLSLYGWATDIGGTMKHTGNPILPGGPFDADTSDILDNLKMVFMGGFDASKNKWSIITDLIYLNVGNDRSTIVTTGTGNQISAMVDLGLKALVVNGAVGYEVVQDDRITLAVIGGLRYTDMQVDSTLTLNLLSSTMTVSEDLLDGIVGVRGFINLTDRWFLPYYADIGAGGSDFTWQALAGVGYRFGWGDIKLAYRYLDYKFDDGKVLEDLTVSGFLLGVTFRF